MAKMLTQDLLVSKQFKIEELSEFSAIGIKSIICNRPDDEQAEQTSFAEIEKAATELGMAVAYIPVVSGHISDQDVAGFASAIEDMPKPIVAYCRSGMRSTSLWALSQAGKSPADEILRVAASADYDLSPIRSKLEVEAPSMPASNAQEIERHQIVIVGGGAAGLAAAASLKARDAGLDILVIDPAKTHYYQPGWTMVGAGIFAADSTGREFQKLMPKGVACLSESVSAFEPSKNQVVLVSGKRVGYDRLIVAPGLKIDWQAVDGLEESLGRNGVTSNYSYDYAPYTWELVQNLKSGRALFTQPPMPIKCAGAPQKAMYLSGDYWHKQKRINDIDIHFHNAGGVLFGVKDYVPALEAYVDKYQADLHFFSKLVAVDADKKTATFESCEPDQPKMRETLDFDMIHIAPPQTAPDFIKQSALADQAGWVDVDQFTLRHKEFDNIWSLGDVMNASNAKTAAAARKQAPIVAANIIADMRGSGQIAQYDGYGSCPLTVERGKIVLAEFGYGGKRMPSFPAWLNNDRKPTALSWFLKATLLPPLYWHAMLKGREWMAKPLLFDA